jgi:hypothetical protein
MSEPQSTTAPVEPELDETTKASLVAMKAWEDAYGRGDVPVLVGDDKDDDLIEFTDGRPFLSGKPGDPERIALIRIQSRYWKGIELATVTAHPRRDELAAFKAPELVQLDFPPPQCAYCEIDLNHDGDGWDCTQCRSWWSSDGYQTHRRHCVEADCQSEADLIGTDGQPRCRSCQFLVVLGVIEATGPYKCSEPYCHHGEVYGMPYNASARRNHMGTKKRCGACQQRNENDAYWQDYVSSRKTTAVETVGSL